ncbi:sensitivity to high expression protein she9 [Haplosporangium sp. Z 27]|nr:sensitivity to high expression protein she9 [Haplosporangium sp. Z 27]
MATHLRLIRPAGSLVKNQLQLSSSFLNTPHSLISNGRLPTSGPNGLINRGFSGTVTRYNDKPANGSKGEAVQATEEETLKKAAEEAERKRVEAQDAVLKEILDSAAAEKKLLEEELAKAAEEKARVLAKKAAEEEARKAAKEAAEKQELERLQRQKSTNTIIETKPSSTPSSTKVEATPTSNASKNSGQLLGSEASSTVNTPQSSTKNTTQPQNNIQGKAAESKLETEGLEPFTAKLLPYKKSIGASTEYLRSAIPDSLRQLSDSVKRKDYRSTIAQLAEHLNSITGYNTINELKHKVIAHGDRLDEARIKLVQAKQSYEDAISTRSDTQKAINDLLQRKHLWSPNDVIRFTDLYRSEHANEQAEQKTKAAYKLAEADVESKSRLLTRVIMERYHEEQVWSDKIRAASTYGTWGLVGVNVMAFLLVQAFVEPRRRRKQVERYEELVQDLTERGFLPEKTLGDNTGDSSVSTSNDTPVAVGGDLLGGEDVLLKLMKSTEERLERMETLLVQQTSGEQGKNQLDLVDVSENGEYVLTDDGSVVFLPNEAVEITEMGESWGEGLSRDTKFQIRSELTGDGSKGRLSLILRDGDVEVPAKRRDLIVSSLGGALIGGLIAVAVMMNR